MDKPLIKIRDFSFSYDGKTPVLSGISADIMAGQKVLLLGPSGCGKSTLTLCLNGIIPNLIEGHLKGSLSLKGMDITASTVPALTRHIGIVFQDPESQFSMLKVEDEVAFGLENLKFEREEIIEKIDSSLKKVGLLGHKNRMLNRLSGGQKQRVSVASILAMDQEILVFDEPTSNLDPKGTEEVASIIRDMPPEKTLIIIEHKLDQFMDIFDKILLLSAEGRMIAYGDTKRILKDYLDHFKEMGIWIPQIPKFFLKLKSSGLNLKNVPLNLSQAKKSINATGDKDKALKILETQAEKKLNYSSKQGNREKALEVKNLSFRFSKSEDPVLQNISLGISKGEFVGIMGPNGSGKTTLAKIIMGLYKTNSPAEVNIFDKNNKLGKTEVLDKCGFIFQNPEHQFIEETVYDEIAYGLKVKGKDKDYISSKTNEVLKLLELENFKDHNPFNLSQGQKRKLSVASMLVMDYSILILDEPTFGLDYKMTVKLMQLLEKINQDDKTIIIITHDMNLIFKYTQRSIILKEGRIIYDQSTARLLDKENILDKASLRLPPLLKLYQEVKNYAVL